MPRVDPVAQNVLPPSLKIAFERHVQEYNTPISNMKGTLGHSLLSFSIYMEWYPLYERVGQITGARAACLFAYAICVGSGCPLCTAFFRRIIIEAGGNPEQLALNDYEGKLLDFGSAIARFKGCISNHVYNSLADFHTDEEMVVLTAFAGQMIAANIFNNVIETDTDNYLKPYIPVKYSSV
jgi:hypothetical protein